ncbi:hypothetical protein BCR39DRAFT_553054 [Naematelia encephala]|uniref:Stealth protein CR3 conserved region 3 domain-containing protein n=1 Tax=Naematelia encephala TaxID=71784 RepID=A0A1Y2AH18_9TREE|nr:hypothetical protein BCR39DRAFT_553054 [Naematelia encephala]
MTPPSLLPVSTGSSSYTTSFDPTSPKPSSSRTSSPPRSRRLASPKPFRSLSPPATIQPVSTWFSSPKNLLRPRVLSPILLWSLALYLVHHFLLPLPLPSLSKTASRPKAADHFLSSVFPSPPLRQGDDTLDSVNPLYRPFSPLTAPPPPFPHLRPTRFLPGKCLEQWFINGETLCGAADVGEEERLDATWLWVNGSDIRWRETMIHWREKEGVYSPEHHFREQGELVHSMRSVLDALPGRLKTFHLLTADFPFEPAYDIDLLPDTLIPKLERDLQHSTGSNPARDTLSETESGVSQALQEHLASAWRVLQTPSWLDFSRRDPKSPSHPYHPSSTRRMVQSRKGRLNLAEANYPTLRYAGHSEVFHLPTMERDAVTEELGEREWKEREWRKRALPNFNSMAIESRVGWLPGLADVTLSLNDDFFLLVPHAVADFHSPLYGSVIRFDHGYYQQVRPLLDKSRFNDAGEMGGLYHANWILSKRFPRRLRPYFAHVPKVITRGLHHEASLMFKEDLFVSSQRRFREMTFGEGDIQMQWLLTSLRVERWREALLWTYVVANLGTLERSGVWSDVARKDVMDMFGLAEDDDDVIKIEVHRGDRWTLEDGRMQKVFEQVGWEGPKATTFLFSSLDGHMPPIPKPGQDPSVHNTCILDLDRCFGTFWSRLEDFSAPDMFKRLAFQYPECGDCLIMALVTASGPLGLSAFFPSQKQEYVNVRPDTENPRPRYLPPPHLPLTPTWHEADFSLESVLANTALPGESVNLREYSMKLLSRYLYLSARSTSHFHMLKSPEHADQVFGMIQDNPSVSILGLNDDIEEGYEEVVEKMNAWFELRWPRKAVWERGWDPIADILDS